MQAFDAAKLREIHELLDEAYAHYFEYEGHCKSSEGFISVEFGNLWDRKENGLVVTNVHIYSYVFCQDGRSQDFASLDDALETVRAWHTAEMAYDYAAPDEVAAREETDQLAAEFLQNLQAQGRLRVINADDPHAGENER